MSAEPITWQTTHGDTVELYLSFANLDRPSSQGNYRDHKSGYRYRVRARNGRIVEIGSQPYTRRIDAIAAAERHHPKVESLSDLPAGGYPEMTGGLSTTEYLDEIRGEVTEP